MKTKNLGRSQLKVSVLGLGCMGMSDFYGGRDEQESIRTLQRALDLGVNFFDTADIYGFGANEELIAKAVAEVPRDRYVLATKFGIVRDPKDPMVRGVNGRPEYVQACCEASLKRLKIDTIDLYYQHRVDLEVPIEETVGAMSRLVEQGKVRYLGLSEPSVETLQRAAKVYPITALQSEYSLWTRELEDRHFAVLRELGVSLVPYSPLGRGFLTGEIKKFEDLAEDDYRRKTPRFQGENFAKNLQLVEKIRELAQKRSATPAQLALAWVMAQGPDIIPIPGTKKVARLEENVEAAEISLSAEDLAEINRIAPKGAAAGTRYPAAMMGVVNR